MLVATPSLAASREEVRAAIDAAAAGTGFSCKQVGWEDVQRGVTAGVLSSYGPNIADVRLVERDANAPSAAPFGAGEKQPLYVVRSDNYNERIATVDATQIAVVTRGTAAEAPRPITLRALLRDFGEHAAYAGCERATSLLAEERDATVTVRFQTVFLPVANTAAGVAAQQKTEFATEVFSYQTHDASDPRNMLVLCTSQGASVQQDVPGRGRVFHHEVETAASAAAPGKIHRYWLEAEASRFAVGGAQEETPEEAAAAVARGRAAATCIGIEAMGRRFNAQLLVQVPLAQKERPARGYSEYGAYTLGGSTPNTMGGIYEECESMTESLAPACHNQLQTQMVPMAQAASFSFGSRSGPAPAPAPAVGKSTAARVSRGTEHDTWNGLTARAPRRDATQHVTITVTTYQTVEGVPSAADVQAAIADLFALYAACKTDRRLQDVAQAQVVAKQKTGIVQSAEFGVSISHHVDVVFVPSPTLAPAVGAGFPRDNEVAMG